MEGPAPTDDRHLVARLAARDTDAMELLYDRCVDAVYAVARRTVPEASAAEELVFEAFLKLWRNPQAALRRHGSLQSYLCDVTSRAARRGGTRSIWRRPVT